MLTPLSPNVLGYDATPTPSAVVLYRLLDATGAAVTFTPFTMTVDGDGVFWGTLDGDCIPLLAEGATWSLIWETTLDGYPDPIYDRQTLVVGFEGVEPEGRFITPEDLAPFADISLVKAQAMIADAETMAVLVAPRLATLAADSPHIASVRAVLRGAILRWHESGSGAITQTAVGQVSQTIAPRRSMFWPSEIEQLRSIGDSEDSGQAFAVDTAPSLGSHSPICSLYWGGACSCGYDIALEPIYEVE